MVFFSVYMELKKFMNNVTQNPALIFWQKQSQFSRVLMLHYDNL